MAVQLHDLVPDADLALGLEPEELGLKILRVLNERPESRHHGANFAGDLTPTNISGYPRERIEEIQHAVLEAWGWLESQCLLAPVPDAISYNSGWVFVTRRGKRITDDETAADFAKASSLPRALLHETLQKKAWPLFRRGDHDVAVLQAFKEVEIAVRTAGNYPDELLGKDLMEEAFKPHVGLLTDKNRVEAEQLGERRLFSGAISSYKNPHSHRHVVLSAEEAAEIIIFASHLLRIVDARSAAST